MSRTFAFLVLLGFTGVLGAPSNDRIVGGYPAQPGQFPHQISLQVNGRHNCGGSIISPNKILTAAHCVYGNNQPMQVVAGIVDLGTTGQIVNVARAVYHPSYNPQTTVNDVAVLILQNSISYNFNVQPISLVTSAPSEGETLTLSGWGLTSYPGNIPTWLQYVNLSNLNLQSCASQLAGIPSPITNGHVCTTSPYGQGACQGDSGGPLIGRNGQVGVVSWGIPCAKGLPDVFTSVTFYRSWILSI